MKSLLLWISALGILSAATPPEQLEALLKTIKAGKAQSDAANKAREAEFLKNMERQDAMLKAVKAELAAEERTMEALKKSIDENEKQIAKLQETLHIRSSNLGEMFGVVRQVSGDQIGVVKSSLVSAQYHGDDAILFKLGQAKELPNVEDLRALWFSLQQHMVRSGEVVRFDADVILPEGETAKQSVIRVGEFTAVSGENFLEYSYDDKAFLQFPRQPDGHYLSLAEDFVESNDALAAMAIDPTRGSMLGMMMERPTLGERIDQGGLVGYVIIVLGLVGIIFALYRMVYLAKVDAGVKKQLENLAAPEQTNPLGRVMLAYGDNCHRSAEDLEICLDEAIVKEVPALTFGHVVVKLFAAIAPLLGLLGTVTGMIATFQSITLFGTGDPKLMAGGISQALVTTVLGLVAAIPLLLLHTALSSKAKMLVQILSEQSAGLMASQVRK